MAAPYYLRYGDFDISLPFGTVLIGRSPDCGVVLNDELVSRQHARLSVFHDGARVEDLGSVNGVLVNGARISGVCRLSAGDQILIGNQCLKFEATRSAIPEPDLEPATHRAPTIEGGLPAQPLPPGGGGGADDEYEVTRRGDVLALIAGVADKLLAMRKHEEAERVLSARLLEILSQAKTSRRVPLAMAEFAARYATKLAQATAKAQWINYVFELYAIVPRPLPADVVEHMYSILRVIPPIRIALLRAYIQALLMGSNRFGPSERFVVKRIQGLEGLAAAR